MAKSSRGLGDQRPAAAVLPGLGGPPHACKPRRIARPRRRRPECPGARRPGAFLAGAEVDAHIAGRSARSPSLRRRRRASGPARGASLRGSRCSSGRSSSIRASAAAQHDLGAALIAAGQLEQAAAGRSPPPSASTPASRAPTIISPRSSTAMGQEEKAMAGYRAAVALKPNLVAAQLRLGDLYAARGLRVEAAAAFRAAARAAKGTVTARMAEARALEASGALRRGSRRDARDRRGASGECGSPRDARQAPWRGRSFGGGRGASSPRHRAFAG